MEVYMTYPWQTSGGVDIRILCASVPASAINNLHADTGIFMPVSAFYITGNTPFAADFIIK